MHALTYRLSYIYNTQLNFLSALPSTCPGHMKGRCGQGTFWEHRGPVHYSFAARSYWVACVGQDAGTVSTSHVGEGAPSSRGRADMSICIDPALTMLLEIALGPSSPLPPSPPPHPPFPNGYQFPPAPPYPSPPGYPGPPSPPPPYPSPPSPPTLTAPVLISSVYNNGAFYQSGRKSAGCYYTSKLHIWKY